MWTCHFARRFAGIEGNYGSFLGYMAGVPPLLKAGERGFEPL